MAGQTLIPAGDFRTTYAADTTVLRLNRTALASLGSREKELAVVTGATHLFEEPGTLERAAELAAGWFARHLTSRQSSAVPG